MREVQELAGPLDVELWASHMLGAMWERRTELPLDEAEDYALIYGLPLVEALARTSLPGARLALIAFAELDDGELGGVARRLAERLPPRESEPSWLACVGETTITAAAVMREDVFDDGFTVFLEARHANGDTHAVGVYIDNNLGVMAKDILLTDSIEQVAEIVRGQGCEEGEFTLEPLEPAVAAAKIHDAVALTEMTLDPPVSEDYPALRALAMLRADEAPGMAPLQGREEITAAERDALRDEFLASPGGHGFARDGNEAYAVSLAIDFCADYVDGRPLRWSPVVVELFMTSWVPRKVLADEGLFEVLPVALDAWVRFAGRKRGVPPWAIETTCEAIPLWQEEMVSAGSDPAGGGPTKQFLMAAQNAGIDLTDEDALMSFVAGWNARSTTA